VIIKYQSYDFSLAYDKKVLKKTNKKSQVGDYALQ